MKLKKIALALGGLSALAFGLAACSKPTPAPAAAPAAESMPAEMPNSTMSEMPAGSPMATGSVKGIGTVTAVDAAAGTVTLDHEAINAIPWPAMTMKFTAEDPSILKGITIGDHVAFELKSAKDNGIVTTIKKQ